MTTAGDLSNTEAPLVIGKLCKSCYFTGCLDEVSAINKTIVIFIGLYNYNLAILYSVYCLFLVVYTI